MKALVTGHLGFLGGHFARHLDAEGWTVDGCDVREPVPTDCRDFFRYDDTRYDLTVHCAAIVGGRAMIEGQPMAVATDLAIDSDYFQWCLRTRPRRCVYFSSSAAYPIWMQQTDSPVKLTESDIDTGNIYQPDQTYGLAKLAGEVQAELVRAEGVPVTVIRTFSGYGEDQDEAYPFPAFIERAARKADPFSIWGNGEQVRDWIHVDDVVAGTLAACENDVKVTNLCTGRPTSFNQLAELVCYQAGYTPAIAHRLDAPVGVRYRVGDPTLMRSFYEPKVELEDGIRRALAARMGDRPC